MCIRDRHSILDFIETAENGEFRDIHFKNRRDEYAQIAAALTRMGRSIERHIDREYVLTLEEQKARMAALQNQINPHFLYNTLEIIRCRALMNRDEEVSTAIENLGSLYRDIVKGDENISIGPVSYTHLDVYKRQVYERAGQCKSGSRR